MSVDASENALPEVERLILDLARLCHWSGLYQPGHPFLAAKVKEVRVSLAERIAAEPGNRLLLGIARDQVMYRDVFLGQGHPLVKPFSESLYTRQVATIGFDEDATEDGMLDFFRSLHEAAPRDSDGSAEEFLERERIPGIFLLPYNYKEVLSRRIFDPGDGVDLSGRGDALWRMLLTANIEDADGEKKVVEELAESPELISAILRRARSGAGGGSPESPFVPKGGTVSPEVLRRMFRRLGETLRSLPDDRKGEILHSLDEGLAEAGEEAPDGVGDETLPPAAFAPLLTADYTDDEFLDLLAALLSSEEKGGKRLQRIFELLAADRDVQGALLPRVSERARESLRQKEYLAVKTWEAIEKLLLSRSEDAYLEEDHSRFMEGLSWDSGRIAGGGRPAAADPALLAAFEEERKHRRALLVLLELLAGEKSEPEFFDLLEEIRKHVPNMISRKEFALLETVLCALSSIRKQAPGKGPEEVGQVIGEVDFGHIVGLFLSREISAEDAERVPAFIAAFGRAASVPVLDRLLMEPEAGRRRVLMSLAVRIGIEAVPAIQERLDHPRWYYVRNLCFILGEIGFRGAAYGLMRALDHPDPRVKREAILALGKLTAPESVPVLGQVLLTETIFASAKDEALRVDAASALFHVGGAEAIGFLHKGKSSRRAAVRDHCAALLRNREGR